MATPNTSLSQLGLSDVNVEYNFSANTARAFNDVFFRNLTGNQQRLVANTPINLSDVSDKAAYDGIIGTFSANTADYGVVSANVILSADSDIISPDVTWSYQVLTGNGNIVFQPDGGKNARLALISDAVGVQTANVQVTANLSFQGQFVGTDSKIVELRTEVYNPDLVVSGVLTVNSAGFVAQSAVTQVTATSNVVGGAIRFSTSPPFGGVVSGNTISFSAVAGTPGIDNNNIYTLTTEVLHNNVVVASNTSIVNVRAIYQQPELTLTFPTSTNNAFQNSGPVVASMLLTANHAVPGANINWSYTVVSGDAPTGFVTTATTANVSQSVGVFGAKKSVIDVKAELAYANGYVLNTKTGRITLRTVSYGLNFVPASDYTAQGYGAQTAVSTATATYQAGDFSWDTALISGTTANTSQAIGASTATFNINVFANTPGTVSSVNRVNAVLRFDGIVIANVASVTTTTAEFTPFNFDVVGPASNTTVGIAPLDSSSFNTATHNVANGYVTWSINNANTNIVANTSTANVFLTTNTINTQVVTLNAKLFDQYDRLVSERVRNITLRAFVPNIRFIGANNASQTGYSPPQTATVSVEARCDTGANSFSVSQQLLSGTNLNVTNYTGNTTYDKIDFTAQSSVIGTVLGTHRITATVNYFGTTFSQTYDITSQATLLDSNYVLTAQNGQANSLNPPVTATANAVASYSVPGGTIQWSTSLVSGAVLDVPIANNTIYQFRTQRTSFGSTNTTLNVTGTLLDSGGRVVKSLTVPVTALATVTDPQLTISGVTNVNVSNTFQATAGTTLVASVAPGVVGATFQWSATLVSGSAASFSPSGNQAILQIQANGVQTLNSVYDITTNCVIGGQVVSTKVTRVSLTAQALSPTINFSAQNASSGDFNFPVNATGVVFASMSPAGGTVEWQANYVAGNGLATAAFPDQFHLGASTTNIGAIDGTYDVIATYKTPNGTVITQRSARVNVRAERYNPAFGWEIVTGNPTNQTGWEETITATGVINASANSSLSGHIFAINIAKVGGEDANYSTNSSQAFLQLSNTRGVHGVGVRSATYDFTCSLIRSGQTLAGPFTRRLTVQTIPYWMAFNPVNPSAYALDFTATASTTVTSNHEAFPSTNITWNQVRISGSGTQGFSTTNNGGVNNRLFGSTSPPANQGTRSSTYTVTANFFANGANRALSTNMTVTAESSFSAGSCVGVDMWLDPVTQAKDVKVGQLYMTWSPEDGFRYEAVQAVGVPTPSRTLRLTTEGGAVLDVSESTPFNLEESQVDLDVYAQPDELLGLKVMVDNYGMIYWDKVVSVEDLGVQLVMPISFGGRSFAAGHSRLSMIYSHNAITKQIP